MSAMTGTLRVSLLLVAILHSKACIDALPAVCFRLRRRRFAAAAPLLNSR
jgi:hypothetical protein